MNIMAARSSEATTPPADSVMPVRVATQLAPGTELPSHYRLCVGCGGDHHCGLHLRAVAGSDLRIVGEFTVTDHHQGAPGLAHGGILATAVDEVMGALNWLVMKPAVTGRLEIDFVRPVPVGSSVHFEAQILGQSGRKVYTAAQGRLTGPSGSVALAARGLFLQVPVAHFEQHGRRDEVERSALEKAEGPQRQWLELNP